MARVGVPDGEGFRARAVAPRPYQVVDRQARPAGQVTLLLAPTAPEAGTPDGPAEEPGAYGRPGQYWLLHTEAGGKIPAVDVTATRAGDHRPMWVAALRVPCGSPLDWVGDQVGVRGPLGTGWDLAAAAGRDLLLIAWEADLTLLRSVIEDVIADTSRFGRLRVWIGGRTWQAIPFQEELSRWSAFADVTVSTGRSLAMAEAARPSSYDPLRTVALLAGPLPAARATAADLARRGLPAERIQLATHPLIRCGDGSCGRCRISGARGSVRACQDGPVIRYDRLADPVGPDVVSDRLTEPALPDDAR